MVDRNAPLGPVDATGTITLADETATATFAQCLARCLAPGWVVHLSGPLGAGKTTLCRALLRSLGYNGRVKSPSYTLVEPYNLSGYTLYHFDFYRFSSEDELRDAGFEEWLDSDAVALVEWPEMAANVLPDPDLLLRFQLVDDTEVRRLQVLALSDRGRSCLKTLLPDATSCAIPPPACF